MMILLRHQCSLISVPTEKEGPAIAAGRRGGGAVDHHGENGQFPNHQFQHDPAEALRVDSTHRRAQRVWATTTTTTTTSSCGLAVVGATCYPLELLFPAWCGHAAQNAHPSTLIRSAGQRSKANLRQTHLRPSGGERSSSDVTSSNEGFFSSPLGLARLPPHQGQTKRHRCRRRNNDFESLHQLCPRRIIDRGGGNDH
jgi:hypothetical protein